MQYKSFGRTCFNIFNFIVLGLVSLSCLLPFLHLLALSFSSSTAVSAGSVGIWPVDFTTASYEFAIKNGKFFKALFVSVKRVLLGLLVNMSLMIITAYPLSKTKDRLVGRNIYMIYFAITMFISGGLIPSYLVVARVGLLDSIWSLILPGALPVYNMIVLMNFIRNLPEEIEEAAFIDGASPFQTLVRVLLPLLKPALATMTLFTIVGHWNSWFDGIIYMNDTANYPLQSYLQTVLQSIEKMLMMSGSDYQTLLSMLNARTTRSAQLFLGALPIIVVYPFLQKHFAKGIVLGSVKG